MTCSLTVTPLVLHWYVGLLRYAESLSHHPGQIAGMAVAGPIADRLGRRGGMVSQGSRYRRELMLVLS